MGQLGLIARIIPFVALFLYSYYFVDFYMSMFGMVYLFTPYRRPDTGFRLWNAGVLGLET